MMPPSTHAAAPQQQKRQSSDVSVAPSSTFSNKRGKVMDIPQRQSKPPVSSTNTAAGAHVKPQLQTWGYMGTGMPPGTMPAGGMPFLFPNTYMMNPFMMNPFMMNPYMMAASLPGMIGMPGMMARPAIFPPIPPTVSANSAPAAASTRLPVQPPAVLPLSMAQLQVAYSNSRLADQPAMPAAQSTSTPQPQTQQTKQQWQHHTGAASTKGLLPSFSGLTPESSGGSSQSTPSTTHLFATNTDSRQGDSEPDILDDDAFASFISTFLGSVAEEQDDSPQASHPICPNQLMGFTPGAESGRSPRAEVFAAACQSNQPILIGDIKTEVADASNVLIDLEACLVDRN